MCHHVCFAKKGKDKGARPAITLSDQVASSPSSLVQSLLCNRSIKFAMIPPEIKGQKNGNETCLTLQILQIAGTSKDLDGNLGTSLCSHLCVIFIQGRCGCDLHCSSVHMYL